MKTYKITIQFEAKDDRTAAWWAKTLIDGATVELGKSRAVYVSTQKIGADTYQIEQTEPATRILEPKSASEKIDKVRRDYAAGRISQEAFEKTVIQLHNQDPK